MKNDPYRSAPRLPSALSEAAKKRSKLLKRWDAYWRIATRHKVLSWPFALVPLVAVFVSLMLAGSGIRQSNEYRAWLIVVLLLNIAIRVPVGAYLLRRKMKAHSRARVTAPVEVKSVVKSEREPMPAHRINLMVKPGESAYLRLVQELRKLT